MHALPRQWLVLLIPALALGCEIPTGLDDFADDGASLVETHRSIVEGVVRGEFNQPLPDVDIVLRFPGSSFPAPTTYTDGAGRFLLVVALYNAHGVGADSAAATIYAFAQQPYYSTTAADHVDVLVRLLPVRQDPPRVSVVLRLPIF